MTRVPSSDGHYEPEVTGMSRQTDLANGVIAYLIAGPAGFGVLGWLLDRWLGVTGFVAVGILVGMGLSLYAIWLRYGTSQAPTTDHPDDGSTRAAAPHHEEIQ